MVALVVFAPQHIDTAAEIEPFKTAITVHFQREWYFVAYALFWLGLGMVLFKGFCRYLCPLGAVMAVGGVLRGRDWIARGWKSKPKRRVTACFGQILSLCS